MSRRKKTTLPSQLLPEQLWHVHEQYELITLPITGEKHFRAVGPAMYGIRLDMDQRYSDFALAYSEIEDAQDALEWLQEVGFPIAAMDITLDHFLGTAAFVRWLMILIHAIANEPHSLRQYLEQHPADNNQYKIDFRPRPAQMPNFHGAYATLFSRDVTPSETLMLAASERYYDKAAWDRDPLLFQEYAAKDYVRRALAANLTGAAPCLEWRQEALTKTWDLVPTMAVPSPWQAIMLALYKEMTGQSTLKKCRRPSCAAFFFFKRSDKDY